MKKQQTQPTPETLDRIKSVVGPQGWSLDPNELADHLVEWRQQWHGKTSLLVKPATSEEVAAIVRICAETATPIVPQGGNTGLVGGQIPFHNEILLCFNRLNKILSVDTVNNTISVQAGCVLAAVQDAAEKVDRLFPLSLASEGSAQIGGVLSTNAGGNAVLRYGTARNLVLGLEVVTAQGKIWDGLKGLRKDNTGYDLKQIFIGAEGTLGIITAAVCKLLPKPRDVVTALVALRDVAAALEFLTLSQTACGDLVSAVELIPRIGIEFVIRHVPDARQPFSPLNEWNVLIEFSTAQYPGTLRPTVETLLERALERGFVLDGVIAESGPQAAQLWLLRERLSEVQRYEGGSLKHDISVPVSQIATFLDQATRAVTAAIPGVRPVPFGHIGDGNIHFNLSQPTDMDTEAFLNRREEIARLVYDIVVSLGGSISAEHGVGVAKRDEIRRYKSAVELSVMKSLKHALDPQGILNPGKVV